MRPFYAVTVNGISVDGELLKIPRRVWDIGRGGGAILDPGTSLTVLVRPAYRAVVAALSKKLAGLPRVTMDPFEYCYNWTAVWLLVGLRTGRRGRQSVKEQQGQQSREKIRFQGRACGCEAGVVWIRLSLERSWHGLLGLRT
jgi:hypothetical protein